MTSENHQRILALVSWLSTEVGHAMGRGSFSFEEGAELLRVHGDKTALQLLLEIVLKLIPSTSQAGTLAVGDIHEALPLFANRETAEAVLLQLPDPDPVQLTALEFELPSALLRMRGILLLFANRITVPVGRRKKLASPSERQSVRDRIGLLLAQGVDLLDAQERVRLQEEKRLQADVSLSTIQRAWREVKRPRGKRGSALK